ncbi:MAG: hypothetical protein KAR00_02435 [Candidatus Pacebacteria bacterium]|nr:hypothetical protein [Candidatus Paceibacterota bacterium]
MKIQQIIIWLVTVAIVMVGFFIFNKNLTQIPQDANKTDNASSTAPLSGVGLFDEEGKSIDISVLPVDLPSPPDMSGPIVFPSGYQESSKMTIIEKIESLRAAVEKNPADEDNWIGLGSYWKLIENYEKAEVAWLYAAEINTASPVALGNLGFLYGYYLNDSAKAEEYYLKAIKRSPDQEYLYFQLAEFYRIVLNDMSKAVIIAEQGVAANPNNENLKALRDSLK